MKKYFTPRYVLTGGMLLIGVILPLFFTNRYFNIQKSKCLFFIISVAAAALVLLVSLAVSGEFPAVLRRLRDPAVLLPAAFLLVCLISTLISPWRETAFLGEGSRYIGFFFLAAGILLLLMNLLRPIPVRALIVPMLVSAAAAAALGILNFVGADLFGLVSSVPKALRGRYLSTFGYSEFFAEYLCIAAVIGVAYFSLRNDMSVLPALFLIYLALILSAGSTAAAVLFLSLLILIPVIGRARGWFKNMVIALMPFPIANVAATLILNYSGASIRPTGFLALLLRPRVNLVLCILLVLLFGLTSLTENFGERLADAFQDNRRRILRIVSIVLAAAGAGFLVFFLLSNTGILPENALTLTDKSLGGRGYIWRRSLRLFKDAPFVRKLFGYGPDTLKLLYNEKLGADMSASAGQIYDSAHNIFLQFLLSTGLFGICTGGCMTALLLVRAFKNCTRDRLPFLGALIAFLLQALLIPSQPMVSPFFFFLAGIAGSAPARHSSDSDSPSSAEPSGETPSSYDEFSGEAPLLSDHTPGESPILHEGTSEGASMYDEEQSDEAPIPSDDASALTDELSD